jgi:hypothetical protein
LISQSLIKECFARSFTWRVMPLFQASTNRC